MSKSSPLGLPIPTNLTDAHAAELAARQERLKTRVYDAANDLGNEMGCAAFYLPGRNDNGMFVAVGTREQIMEMLKEAP